MSLVEYESSHPFLKFQNLIQSPVKSIDFKDKKVTSLVRKPAIMD